MAITICVESKPAEYPKPQQSFVEFQSPSRLESISGIVFLVIEDERSFTTLSGVWQKHDITDEFVLHCSQKRFYHIQKEFKICPGLCGSSSLSWKKEDYQGEDKRRALPFLCKVMQDPIEPPFHPPHVLHVNFEHSPRAAHARVVQFMLACNQSCQHGLTWFFPPALVLAQSEGDWGVLLLLPHLCIIEIWYFDSCA